MKSLSFNACSEVAYVCPNKTMIDNTDTIRSAIYSFSPDGKGQLMVSFCGGPVKAASFNFLNTELPYGEVNGMLMIKSRCVEYSVNYDGDVWKQINPSAYAEILTDGATASFDVYDAENGHLFLVLAVR